jgi:hypothetical protein
VRWIRLIDRLQAIDPLFAHWYSWTEDTPIVRFDPRIVPLAQKMADTVFIEDGTPEPRYGYRTIARNTADLNWGPRYLSATMHAGNSIGANWLNMGTDYGFAPDPDVITYPIFKGAVLAFAETFEATRACAYPDTLMDLWPSGRSWPTLCLSWISYVAPRFVHLITPPPTAIVERRPDGGLLMAATDETFSTANPAHLAVARDIEAAIAPLNALPWPPETHG